MIYLDNSATSFPKPKEVINAVNQSFTKYGANPGRSGHSFSLKTAMKIAEIRAEISEFISAEAPENVIFTSGCTDALNLAILGSCQKGGHIICTSNDHNSSLRPIFELKSKGLVEVTVAKPSKNDKLRAEDILKCIKPNTYLICCNHISNVDGMEADIYDIGKICYEKCITFLVDAAQSIGHKQINMLKQRIDLLAFSPHKGLYAPQGVGVLAFSSKTKLRPIKFGGTGTESYSVEQPKYSPECFESGTLPTPSILGLGAGLKFVIQNFDKINKKLEDLIIFLNYELSRIKNVKVYTHPDNANGILSFNIGDIPSVDVAEILDKKYNIMVRSGLHCAPFKHIELKTLQQGTVRVSISFFNTYTDITKTIKAVKNIASKYESEKAK
jgi:cysteine desulfurase/selenocysteine lyase